MAVQLLFCEVLPPGLVQYCSRHSCVVDITLFLWQYTPRGPRTYQFLWNNSVLAGDSSSGPQGNFTFLYGLKKYNRGNGRKRTKNKRTIWAWVNSKCKKGKFVTLHSLCICRLSLTCSFREISTRVLGMPTHLDWLPHCWPLSTQDCELILSVFLTSPGLYLTRLVSSAVRCQLPLSITLRQLPSLGSFFQLPSLAFLCQLPVSSKISSSGLCLVSRQNRQRDRLLGGPPT